MSWHVDEGRFQLGDFQVESGEVIRSAELSWQSHGTLNDARDNVIIYPCSYMANHDALAWLIGPDKVLDPSKYFIVVPDMFSNGFSSSAADDDTFPQLVTMGDNVRAQYRLLTEYFGVTSLQCAYGFSMGAGQAYNWASIYPDFVKRAIVVCGSARTSDHNKVFLSGLLRTLEAAPEYIGGGHFSAEPTKTLKAFGHIYAGWALSQDFYREGLYRSALGAQDLDTFLQSDWEASFMAHRAANLYSQAVTWYHNDISRSPSFGGDIAAALQAIKARVLLMPGETDLYFRVADNEAELPYLQAGELRVIRSIWGHRAGNPAVNQADYSFLKASVHEWLNE
ncbi:MAG: alpha/beta fold hydrolase [Actinomycetota bacterium]|nr:alpha/beta fold hydrolase [Actinomycetota bacterium]